MTFDPTQETWWVDDDGQVLTRDLAASEFLAFLAPYKHSDNDGGEKPDEEEYARRDARARLASAAPEMARVLLELSSGEFDTESLHCADNPMWSKINAALQKAGMR